MTRLSEEMNIEFYFHGSGRCSLEFLNWHRTFNKSVDQYFMVMVWTALHLWQSQQWYTSVVFNHEMEIFNFKWKRTHLSSVSNQIAASFVNTILTVTISKSLCHNLSNCCLCKEVVCNSRSYSKICCISVDNWLICSQWRSKVCGGPCAELRWWAPFYFKIQI